MSSNASGSPNTLSTPSPSANRPPAVTSKTNRLPVPTLFVGPPSRNASQLSIVRTNTHDSASKSGRDGMNRGKSALSRPFNPNADPAVDEADAAKDSSGPPALKKSSERDIEKRWKEMQSTLNEVELTAQSTTHVFSESHAAALDDLRKAQVELARAWGRGHDDKTTVGPPNESPEGNIHRFTGADEIAMDRRRTNRPRADTAASSSTALSDESSRSDLLSRSGRSQLEDETAQDIKLASERRGANEAYFKKVDSSVRDVVAKLEVVAEAMRGVEGESRSLWSSSGASDTIEEPPRASIAG